MIANPANPTVEIKDFEYGLCSCFSHCNICSCPTPRSLFFFGNPRCSHDDISTKRLRPGLCSWFCPCLQVGQTWMTLEEDSGDEDNVFFKWCSVYFLTISILDVCCFFLASTFLRCWIRVKLRKEMGYRERPIYDFVSALCCPCCMIAQNANQVNNFVHGWK